MRANSRELVEYTPGEALAKIAAIQAGLEKKKKPDQDAHFFMNEILDAVERMFIAEIRERQAAVPGLQTHHFGHVAILGEELTPGCTHCVERGLAAIRSSSDCNLSCEFCYYGESRRSVKLLARDQFEVDRRPVSSRELKLMLSKSQGGKGALGAICWVFLEPFSEFDKHPDMVRFVHELGIHQHLYTNGTLCTRENLTALADAGLEEIRFNLAATQCSNKVLEAMRIARELFPYVCIESPMFPEYFERFVAKRTEILATGVDHIHCAEIHLNAEIFGKYRDEELYQYSRGYVSPMSSRRLTYDLMDLAARERWSGVTVHDCSNEVKFLRGVSSDRFGVLSYEAELPGVPIWWFRSALERYDLTTETV
jgi:uncharacterized protein